MFGARGKCPGVEPRPRRSDRRSNVRPAEEAAGVIPEGFHDFLVASGGVAGALIGLLFVAISVAPERLLAADAAPAHRVRASTALTTFSNALTVSLLTLIPGLGAGWTAFVVATVGAPLRRRLGPRPRPCPPAPRPGELRDGAFLVGVAVVFVLQLWFGLRLVADDADIGALRGICILVVVCFLVGIARAWELIGGPSFSLGGQLAATLRERGRAGAEAGGRRPQGRPLAGVEAAPHAPGRAGEREVGHGGQPGLVGAEREQQVRRAVGRGQAGSGTPTHQQSTRGRPSRPRRTSRAPVGPTSHVPRRPGSSTSPVRVGRSRASWPTRSPSSPSAVASGPSPARPRPGAREAARRSPRGRRRARG